MKKLLIYLLVMTLLLAGCGEKAPDSTTSQEELPPAAEESLPQEAPEEPAADGTDLQDPSDEDVSFGWERQSRGAWPFEQTVEFLQFYGSENPELTAANEAMLEEAAHQMACLDAAVEKGEEQCRADGDSWGSLWVYPVTTDRYLSAVTVNREHMQFRIDDPYTWNLVVNNFVYDKEEQRLISLEEALDRMDMSVGDLERAVWEFADNQNIGTYEKLSSIGFYMDPEGYPVFILGAIVYGHGPSVGWPTFFNWDNGEIRWPGEEPMPLYLVDSDWADELSCLQGMGQYDGAAIISEQEAFDTLVEIVDVQELLAQGMVMTNYGVTENIDGEEHVCIAVGTDHGDQFVTEFLYAVSWLSVYCMDPIDGEWVPVGFG